MPRLLLLRSVVDLVEGASLAAVGVREDLCDGSGQRRLAVIDMTESWPTLTCGLPRFELLLGHFVFAPVVESRYCLPWPAIFGRTRESYLR